MHVVEPQHPGDALLPQPLYMALHELSGTIHSTVCPQFPQFDAAKPHQSVLQDFDCKSKQHFVPPTGAGVGGRAGDFVGALLGCNREMIRFEISL